jgi:hypothetical protein
MQFTTKSTKENANTKGTKEYIFGTLCIELCVLCVNTYFFSLIFSSLRDNILKKDITLHKR